MNSNAEERAIYGDPSVFAKCRADKKFAYVVALARAVNALNAAHSLMQSSEQRQTPEALRDRMNSQFFASGILYESLKLIRAMNKVFAGETSFETSLRLILKDTSGRAVEQMHLKSVRHGGVFHFLPDKFKDAIAKTPMTNCVFASIVGERRGDVHYTFADYITAEMMVGTRIDNKVVVEEMMNRMLNLVKQVIEHSENFIADQLRNWGFEVLPTSPATQSQR